MEFVRRQESTTEAAKEAAWKYCFTVDRLHTTGGAGILAEDIRVKVIDGVVLQMSSTGSKHRTSVTNEFLPRRSPS
jgi:hypothetical protein